MEEGQQASEIKANESNDDLINRSMIVDPPVIKDNWNIQDILDIESNQTGGSNKEGYNSGALTNLSSQGRRLEASRHTQCESDQIREGSEPKSMEKGSSDNNISFDDKSK